MNIDKDFKIDKDNYGYTLVKETKVISEKGNNIGQEYLKKDVWYYPSIKFCLMKYVDLKISECDDVKNVINRINLLEELISYKIKNELATKTT